VGAECYWRLGSGFDFGGAVCLGAFWMGEGSLVSKYQSTKVAK